MSPVSRLGDTARGIALMVFAVFLLSIMDVMAKSIAHRSDIVMSIWARYAGQTVLVAVLVAPRLRRVLRSRYPGLQLLRSVFLLGATACFLSGFVLIGLADATAIMSLNPVLIALGAGLFLGERFGARRAVGVGAALLGALIVIRPGSEVFSPYAALPLAAAVFYSGYALATRFVGRDEDAWTSLFYTAAFGAVVMSAVVPFFWVKPDAQVVGLMFLLGPVGAAAHLCLIRAFMLTEATSIAPFSYVGLLFAILWGQIMFGETPDGATYLGALVIVGAGIYVWHRETRAMRPAPT